jgi:4-hydroxy-2-oxoheptanedioate aldolase
VQTGTRFLNGGHPMRSFQQLQEQSRTPLGTICCLGSIDAIELASHAGFDFVIIDGQHGPFELRDLREAIRAVDAAGGFPIVRLPANGLAPVEPLLDAGCPAFLAPMVNSPEQAAELVAAACYPPAGRRSQSGCRASLRGGATYRQDFNHDFALIVMIEHMDAVLRIGEILAVPGVAACFIGPTDLVSSMESASRTSEIAGLPAAAERVLAAAAAAGKPAGIAASNLDDARRSAAQGFSFIVLGTDRRFLAGAFEKSVGAWRAPAG